MVAINHDFEPWKLWTSTCHQSFYILIGVTFFMDVEPIKQPQKTSASEDLDHYGRV